MSSLLWKVFEPLGALIWAKSQSQKKSKGDILCLT
nr:MAG TPA: hypothetical protein [Caudoviricetes sp.]